MGSFHLLELSLYETSNQSGTKVLDRSLNIIHPLHPPSEYRHIYMHTQSKREYINYLIADSGLKLIDCNAALTGLSSEQYCTSNLLC